MNFKNLKQIGMALLLGCSGLITMQAQALVIDGTLTDHHGVQYINFNVAQASEVTIDVLASEYDSLNGIFVDVNADGEFSYLSPVIHLFAGSVATPAGWIAMSMGAGPEGMTDGSLNFFGPGSPFVGTSDPYLSLNLAAGNYVIALGSIFFNAAEAVSGTNPQGVTEGDYRVTITITEIVDPVVPEPATLSLLGLGLAGAAVARRRRKA